MSDHFFGFTPGGRSFLSGTAAVKQAGWKAPKLPATVFRFDSAMKEAAYKAAPVKAEAAPVKAPAPLHECGLFAYPDFNGRWYVGAEWHFPTDTDEPTRIILIPETQNPIEHIEVVFNRDGYESEILAIAAIKARAFPAFLASSES